MTTPLKIIFAGTPSFAAIALQALLHSSHRVIAVYTQPDKPAGRGLKLTASAVKELALAQQLPIYQPNTLKDAAVQAQLAQQQADVMVVAAYGMLLPAAVLSLPKYGCINIHPSLLPRWRGAAPIQRTLFAGDKVTGVTIMQMDAGLDTGPMLWQKEIKLALTETSAQLHDQLAHLGAQALLETLDLIGQGQLHPVAQDHSSATYAQKITKEEARINWQQSAFQLDCMIRAFNPWPVCYTTWQHQNLRIWRAEIISAECKAVPGTIVQINEAGIEVATGNGVLRLLQVQLPGGKIISAPDFYHAKKAEIKIGSCFD